MANSKLLDLLDRVKSVQGAVASAATSAIAFDNADDTEERNRLVECHRHAHIVALATLVGVVADLEELVVEATTPVAASSPERH